VNPETIRGLYLEGAKLLGKSPDGLLDARLLLLHAAELDERRFFADPDFPLSARVRGTFFRLVRKRLAGCPIAYIVGRKEFRSLSFRVTAGVLIPRPETEILVDTVIELAGTGRQRILDLGTGSGNIAVALARDLPRARITAVDISRRALAVATSNAAVHGVGRVRFLPSDLFSGLGRRARFDIIASNPPYIGRKDWGGLAPDIRDHEPRRALVGGESGTEFVARLVRRSPAFLRPRGFLAIEIGAGQEKTVAALFGENWESPRVIRDLAGIPRVLVARLAAGRVRAPISGPGTGVRRRSRG
jgi:release factor glutamine methyltransferase